MAATTVAGLATVAQLALYVHGLVTKITTAADTARQNKLECQNLARRVSVIGDLLVQLQDPGVAQPLAGLGDTLQEAHDLVVACQKWSVRRKFLYADDQAERFREVNRRIDSHLILIPLLSHISIARRLDQVVPPNPTSVLLPAAPPTMVAASAMASTYVPVEFASAEIAFLTGNFGHVLTEDGSATVYKGRLHDGQEVAVKSLKNHGPQRHEQEGAFVAELETICHLRHDHIVPLVGWCAEDDDRMFVYQYQHTSNGTLRDHLMQGGSRGSASASPVTSSWKACVQALLGVSMAVDHLHRVAEPRIIHRNVSSSSILMDESWAARVSGFGAAVLQEPTTGGQLVGEVAGTFGYIDPEYRRTRRVGTASDVYSFGVVMLEVLTGRPPSWEEGKDPKTLAGFAAPLIEGGSLGSVLDWRPSPVPTPGQMEALNLVAYTAARCLWSQPQDRPAMSNVVTNLEAALGLIDNSEPKRHYY
ncbi:putative serine/threonine-protein kinase-like protein CCR3 [Triticum aestivum]|uniref:putative serine/threonine-protein kinase-like protein CCR3 n=1 Tax=Triticum aestivum TaxID=4565 RepID=UPI001D02A2D2|nr:putative serine/threonine-protein kinase-like protein CCR3 [Triticum aestivum]